MIEFRATWCHRRKTVLCHYEYALPTKPKFYETHKNIRPCAITRQHFDALTGFDSVKRGAQSSESDHGRNQDKWTDYRAVISQIISLWYLHLFAWNWSSSPWTPREQTVLALFNTNASSFKAFYLHTAKIAHWKSMKIMFTKHWSRSVCSNYSNYVIFSRILPSFMLRC